MDGRRRRGQGEQRKCAPWWPPLFLWRPPLFLWPQPRPAVESRAAGRATAVGSACAPPMTPAAATRRRTTEEVMKRGMLRRELRSACGVGGVRGCVKNARGFRFFTIRFLHAPVPSCVIPRSRVPMETIGRRHCFLLQTRDPPRESRVPMQTIGRRHCFLLETRDPPRESRVPMETIGRRHCFLLETRDPPSLGFPHEILPHQGRHQRPST
jgi:hypothetical protein